ncbi:MAG TPA: 6-pyruvoyl-tetrahydropterin synthase-related protein, partial [Blastocatellia bacterium]|nr:6-pyruvoyl-tetrahydropterin synthase-related protein [Blastocatellia bacterium]
MKSLLTAWSRPGLIVLAALIAGTAFSAPFFFRQTSTLDGKVLRTPKTHDLAQHLAVMEQFDNVLKTGVLYPRWLPDVNNGYGLPWTNFYPPGLYYLTSLINSTLNNSMNTLFVVSVLSLAASGLALYGLSRQMYGRLASAVAAVIYVAAPYHLLDLYWRGAMPELAGFVLAPIIIYFAFKLGSFGRARYYAGLGFFHGLFVMTHIPVAFLMSYALMFYALVWAARERDWRIAARITSGIAIAFVLSAIYWLPAFLEISSAQEHFSSIFPYHSSYITLLRGIERFDNVLNVSFAATAVAVLTAVAILSRTRRAANENHSEAIQRARSNGETQTRLWIVMGIATTFMCTSLSIYVSKLLPKIDIASFAWRWMVLASLFAALLVAAAVDRLQRGADLTPSRLWACRAAISAVVVLNIWITTQAVVVGAFSNPLLDPPPSLVEAGFTPKGSTDPRSLPATALVTTQPAGGTSEIIRWDPEHREVHLSVREPSRVRLKTYNFPGWVARVDGQPAPMLSDQDGIQVVEVPEGVHKIEIWFSNTLPRTA